MKTTLLRLIFKRTIFTVIAFLFVLSTVFSVFANSDSTRHVNNEILKIGTTHLVDTLNVFTAKSKGSFEIFGLVYSPLTTLNRGNNPEPALAQSWTTSDDGLVWTFSLRQGVRWSDGERFTSKDVKFTYDTILTHKKSMYYEMAIGIVEVSTPDNNTVVFKLDFPRLDFLQSTIPIVPEHIWRAFDDDALLAFENKNPVGTGMFLIAGIQDHKKIQFSVNKKYFLESPKVRNISFLYFDDESEMADSLFSGEIDVVAELYPKIIENIARPKEIEILSYVESGVSGVGFNFGKSGKAEFINNRNVRKAIELSIDKNRIIKDVFGEAGEIGSSIIPTRQAFFHNSFDAADLRSFSKIEALRMFESAGFNLNNDGRMVDNHGNQLKLKLLTLEKNEKDVLISEIIRRNLGELGVLVDVYCLSVSECLFEIETVNDYDLFVGDLPRSANPTSILKNFTTAQAGSRNYTKYSNKKYDELVIKQELEADFGKKKTLVLEAQKIVYDDVAFIAIAYWTRVQLVNSSRVSPVMPTVCGAMFFVESFENYRFVEMTSSVFESVTKSEKSSSLKKRDTNGASIYTFTFAALATAIKLVVTSKLR